MKTIGALQNRYRVDDNLAILPSSTSVNRHNMKSMVSAAPSHSINQQVEQIEYLLLPVTNYEFPAQSINVYDLHVRTNSSTSTLLPEIDGNKIKLQFMFITFACRAFPL